MSPITVHPKLRREIRQREPTLDILQFDAVCEISLIATGARAFKGDDDAVSATKRHQADLDVTEKHHAGWTPILNGIRKDIRIHEWAPCLARPYEANLAVR